MTEKSKNLIKEEMLNLPKEAQEAINASGWEKVSEEIGKKYLLNEDEIETFQLETASFLLGFIDEDSYTVNIEDEVGVSKDEALKIAEEANERIFTPINNFLTEKIKRNLKDKNANWQQSIDFILSGGDYSAFLAPTPEKVGVPTPNAESWDVGKEEAAAPETPIKNEMLPMITTPPTLADTQANAQKIALLSGPKNEEVRDKLTI